MADYIKFRLSAAKAGVTMAFLALLGGIAEARPWGGRPARASQSAVRSDKWTPVLSLNGITGNLRTSLLKIENDLTSLYQKDHKLITGAIGGVYHKVTDNFYDKHAANATFLKIKGADSTFLTLKDAGGLLDKDGTAANSAELGGKTADAFIQGTGGITTGGTTVGVNPGPPQFTHLVSSTDGALSAGVQLTGNGSEVQITNNSSASIDWVSSQAAPDNFGTITGNGMAVISLADPGDAGQVTIQFLPAVQNQAFTLVVSAEPGAGVGQPPTERFVGQMINGDG
jgi:hypothetical protein